MVREKGNTESSSESSMRNFYLKIKAVRSLVNRYFFLDEGFGISAHLPLTDFSKSHKRFRSLLREQDPTVWINFCLLESVM